MLDEAVYARRDGAAQPMALIDEAVNMATRAVTASRVLMRALRTISFPQSFGGNIPNADLCICADRISGVSNNSMRSLAPNNRHQANIQD